MKLGTQAQSLHDRRRASDGGASDEAATNAAALPFAALLDRIEAESRSRGSAQEMISELSHDLRQPLTSLKMNLQCALRLLQLPNPRIAIAVEALTDCLGMESDITELVAQAHRRTSALVTTTTSFAVNDLVHDLVTTIRCFEPAWRKRLVEELAEESPLVEGRAWRLRFSLLSTVRHLLLLDEWNESADNPLHIEVRSAPSSAQIALTEVPAESLESPRLQPMLSLMRTVSHRLGGTATTEITNDRGLVLVSLPLAPPNMRMLPGGPHGV
jgi:hypothetical protein